MARTRGASFLTPSPIAPNDLPDGPLSGFFESSVTTARFLAT